MDYKCMKDPIASKYNKRHRYRSSHQCSLVFNLLTISLKPFQLLNLNLQIMSCLKKKYSDRIWFVASVYLDSSGHPTQHGEETTCLLYQRRLCCRFFRHCRQKEELPISSQLDRIFTHLPLYKCLYFVPMIVYLQF